jgi:uncharacterized protein YegP (UPF0339 family)
MGHFEIIHNDNGYRCRQVAANGETIWWTEHYADVRDAEKAIVLMGEMFGVTVRDPADTQVFVLRHVEDRRG